MTQSPAHSASESPLPSPKERRRLREAKSMSELEVATALGVTRATVRAWESGRSDPRGRRRIAYARLLTAPASVPGPVLDPAAESVPADEPVAAAEPVSEPLPEHLPEPLPESLAAAAPPSAAPRAARAHRGPVDSRPPRGSRIGLAGRTTATPVPVIAAAAPTGGEPAGGEATEPVHAEPDTIAPVRAATDGADSVLNRADAPGPPPGLSPGLPPEPLPAVAPPPAGPVGSAPPLSPTSPAAQASPTPPGPPGPPGDAPTLDALTPEEAFDALYDHTAVSLVRQAYLLTGRHRLSHECVERAFRLSWQHWPEVARDRDPVGWVRAAAYEFAMSPWQRLRPAHRHPDTPSLEGGPSALLDALLSLPPAYRRTLLLYDGLGLDLPETAAETEASTPAAANRVLHAREAVAEQVPGLTSPEILHRLLAELADAFPAPEPAPAPSVREGSERHVWLWTRTALTVTALIVGATGFTLLTSPHQYEPGVPAGRPVQGIPAHAGSERLGPEGEQLRARLRAEMAGGPERLAPEPR